jgi:SnoaL-like domain
MSNYDEMAKRYIDTWNQTDPAVRRAAIDQLYSEDARYVDPVVLAEGRDAIDATIAAVQAQFPGFVFRLAGPVDGHHDQARFGWELGPVGEPAPIVGFDVAVTDSAGRVKTVLGFLDKVPAAAG